MGWVKRAIRTAYKVLSIANTAEIVTSGNPKRIAKHIMRRKVVRRAGRLIK